MADSSVQVLTHGHCFDGLVSAVLFTRLLRRLEPKKALSFGYRSCGYGPKLKVIPKGWLSSPSNAILDFRYVENDRLTWYFDHHKTAFASSDEQRVAKERVAASKGARTMHYDPECTSCAKLIARVSLDVYASPDPELESVVEWADRVDSARFDDPIDAFDSVGPALRLADVVERHGDTAFLNDVVPRIIAGDLDTVADSPQILELAAPLAAAKKRFLARLSEVKSMRGEVACFDLGDETIVPAGKFATYVAAPTCRYAVILLKTRDQIKLGVGHNPWSGKPRLHDVATLCQREGGGGHPVVGAVNFPHEKLDAARAAFGRMVENLNRT